MTAHHLICAQRAHASGYNATARAMAKFSISLSGGSPFGAAPAQRSPAATVLRSASGLSAGECHTAPTGQGMRPPSEQSSLPSIST
jgi:hypothetical protein